MIDLKYSLRRQALAVRRAAHQAGGETAGARAAACFTAALTPRLSAGAVVAAYWPMGDELDPRPLLQAAAGLGCRTALPVVVGAGLPLLFRQWAAGQPLQPGAHGTCHPLPEAPLLVPDLVVVPLLAFDRRGGRLGYGGGYYDRTLADLRRGGGSLLAVGLAYGAQAVDAVPRDGHDQDLDWIVTESGAMEADQ